jgi:mannose-6-phosphate isomerase-like protein (cupin superfamily)
MGRATARFIDKPWGHEEIFACTDRYVGKILCIKAGEALSLQYHRRKEETLRVLDGVVEFAAGDVLDRLVTHRPGAAPPRAPGTSIG